jgi:hypothetical protein
MLIAQVRVEEGRKLGSMSHLDHERRITTRHSVGQRVIVLHRDKIQVLEMTQPRGCLPGDRIAGT